MPDRTQEVISLAGPTLNIVPSALELASRAVRALERGDEVVLDFRAVERLTPSFANALAMTILEAVGQDRFRARVSIRDASELVAESWAKAVGRYARGIRLTTQRQGAA